MRNVWITLVMLPLCAVIGVWLALTALGAAQAAPAASAIRTYVVTTTADSGSGSLRQALMDASLSFQETQVSFNLSGCPCIIHLQADLPQPYYPITLTGPGPNLLAIDGGDARRVLYFVNGAVIENLTVQHGAAPSSLSGGGIKNVGFTLTLRNVILRDNSAVGSSQGKGGAVATEDLIAINTQFINNHADYDGAAYVQGSAGLTNTLFLSNTANYMVGAIGIVPGANTDSRITNSIFRFNSAQYESAALSAGNGIDHDGNPARLDLTVHNSLFDDNATAGGSIFLFAGNNLLLVNSLFANNAAAAGALHLSGDTQVLHTTLAQSDGGSGVAIGVYTATIGVTDTIIASYTVGIQRYAFGSVYEDYNLFFATGTITQGSSIGGGGHLSTGNPKFANPAGGDYHLTAGSAAINTGINAGVNTDYDGQPRPLGGGFDIGFDEYINLPDRLFLPVIVR